MDSASEARLELVCPALAALYRQLAAEMEVLGEPVKVIRGLVSWEDQEKLWDQGRTTPGEIVTNAPPGHSWHEGFGMAVDGCPVSLLPTKHWSPGSSLWVQYGSKAKALGLFWGGDFIHVPDRPHTQLTGKFPVSPHDRARFVLQTGGAKAVWAEAGL